MHNTHRPKNDHLPPARVGRFPGHIHEVEVPEEGQVVGEVLAEAELDLHGGYELRLNGTETEIEEKVHPGDTVLLVKKITGNK